MVFFFGLGSLFYVSVLLVNAVAILSEDRFLARIGWGGTQDPGFGGAPDSASVKSKIINLINSVRTLMRGTSVYFNMAVFILYCSTGLPSFHQSLNTVRNHVLMLGFFTAPNSTVPLIAINTLIIIYKLVLG